MKKNSYSFFQNKECEYFPCHKGANPETFNCLFCYCPLYAMGKQCGGDFIYSKSGVKKCSECLVPHGEDSYDYIVSKIVLMNEMLKKQEEKK